MGIVADLVIVGLIAGLTWALTSEGLWGAVLMFFNVLFGGLIAFNFYEPLARLIDSTGIGWGFSDTLSLLGLFIISTFLLRLITESLAPAMVRFPTPVYHLGRLFFGLAGAVVTVAILLVAFETAPVHKKILGVIDFNTKPPFGMGLDRKWLAFFQYTTGLVFAEHVPGSRDPFREYGDSKVFDPKAEWLLNHQEARPYGNESIHEAGGAEAAPGGAAPGGAPGGAMPPPGGAPGAMPPPGGAGAPGEPKVIGPGPGGGVVIPG
jgi:hypothetical protein